LDVPPSEAKATEMVDINANKKGLIRIKERKELF
jgi:hypothetical protein